MDVKVKMVKPEDFDNATFKGGGFDIVMRSKQSVISTLRFLSEQGYIWGGTETSLLKDTGMKEQLLEHAVTKPIYITIDDRIPNGVSWAWASPYMLYTYGVVEIDFEEGE